MCISLRAFSTRQHAPVFSHSNLQRWSLTGIPGRRSGVGPPVAAAVDVVARSAAEAGRAEDEELEAARPGFVPPPRARRDAHRIPFLQLDDLVVELHPPASADD